MTSLPQLQGTAAAPKVMWWCVLEPGGFPRQRDRLAALLDLVHRPGQVVDVIAKALRLARRCRRLVRLGAIGKQVPFVGQFFPFLALHRVGGLLGPQLAGNGFEAEQGVTRRRV